MRMASDQPEKDEKEEPKSLRMDQLEDSVLCRVFKYIPLFNRTYLESVCTKWSQLIPTVTRMDEFYPDDIKCGYVAPKNLISIPEHLLENVFMSLFKKCKSFKRFTTEYHSKKFMDQMKSNEKLMKDFCKKITAIRPDVEEIVVDGRNTQSFIAHFATPLRFAVNYLNHLNLNNPGGHNQINSLIIHNPSWNKLDEILATLVMMCHNQNNCCNITKLTLSLTSVEEHNEPSAHMDVLWKMLQENLTSLKFVYRLSPKFYGFEHHLVNLQELQFRPSEDQMRIVSENIPNLRILSITGDIKIIKHLVQLKNLQELSWSDADDYEREDNSRVFYSKRLFNSSKYDRKNEATEIFNHFFMTAGKNLTKLSLRVILRNILSHDLLNQMPDELKFLSLNFHRRSFIIFSEFLFEKWKHVKDLSIGYQTPLDATQLESILDSCPKLRKISCGILFPVATDIQDIIREQDVSSSEDDDSDDGEDDDNDSKQPKPGPSKRFKPDVDTLVNNPSSILDSDEDSNDNEQNEDVEMDNEDEAEGDDGENDGSDDGDVATPEEAVKSEIITMFIDYGKKCPNRRIDVVITAQVTVGNLYKKKYYKDIVYEDHDVFANDVTDDDDSLATNKIKIDFLNPESDA